jgi:peptide/nickel transport system ATP-binding protein
MAEGENLGIVGEVGSGKTTLSRLIANLGGISEGKISFFYKNRLEDIRNIPNRYYRRHLQLVFQDCGLALNPRLKIYQNLEEVYRINFKKNSLKDHIQTLIGELALGGDVLAKYPGDLSGGTQRRVFLSRALAALGYLPGENENFKYQADSCPKLLILDELTRGLDIPIQHKIVNFLIGAQNRLNLTYLIISHDFKIVNVLCKQVLVLHRGRLVELMSADCLGEEERQVFHPYTKLLLGDNREGNVRPKANKVNGKSSNQECHYRHHCLHEIDICSRQRPLLNQVNQDGGKHLVACHRYN